MADQGTPPEDRRDMSHQGRPVPLGVDPAIPSPARMYDYYLGGKDNYAADREAANKALSVVPSGRRIARANRYFLMRAVLLMADEGVNQFIDLGTGIPTSPSVHELVRAIHPRARVLYVDNDAVVTAHNRAILADSMGVEILQADIREPTAILASPELGRLIDFTQPVGVLFVAVLHFVQDSNAAHGAVNAFASRMVPGSYLALSHITSDGTDASVVATVQEAYANASFPAVFRAKEEIGTFFSGFELVGPGLVDVTQWFPYAGVFSASPPALPFLGGVGRKI
jgi:S-adenosyl methyltransferase